LFGVIQGAQYEDLRKDAAKFMGNLPFDGYGIGGALEKENMGKIIRWVNEILPEDKPKHLLGISEPDDMFEAVEQGIDTFDCVSPTRVARNGAAYTLDGRINLKGQANIVKILRRLIIIAAVIPAKIIRVHTSTIFSGLKI
jgi:queuine tRNA-ribosyltransferase